MGFWVFGFLGVGFFLCFVFWGFVVWGFWFLGFWVLGFFVFCVLGLRGLGFLVAGKGTEVDLGFWDFRRLFGRVCCRFQGSGFGIRNLLNFFFSWVSGSIQV